MQALQIIRAAFLRVVLPRRQVAGFFNKRGQHQRFVAQQVRRSVVHQAGEQFGFRKAFDFGTIADEPLEFCLQVPSGFGPLLALLERTDSGERRERVPVAPITSGRLRSDDARPAPHRAVGRPAPTEPRPRSHRLTFDTLGLSPDPTVPSASMRSTRASRSLQFTEAPFEERSCGRVGD